MHKLSKVSFFLFVTVYNYLWFRMILFHYLYNEYGNMGLFYVAFLGILVLAFLVAMPKKMMQMDYGNTFQKSFVKFPYACIMILESVFSITFCSYLISAIFIKNSNFFIILLGIIVAVLVLSRLIPKDVIEISTLFHIVGYAILTISFLFLPTLDYTNVFPVKSMNGLIPLFLSIMILGDNFSLLISKKEISFSKLPFILAVFIAILFLGFEFFLLLCTGGSEFFKDISYVGFISFSIEPVSKYIGSFDFSYIFYILISCIFKFAYNLSLIRSSITTISSKVMNLLLAVTLIVLGLVCYYYIPIGKSLMYICYILTSLSFLIIFWFIKECYFVRKSEEK